MSVILLQTHERRRVALARKLDHMVRTGEVSDYGALARLGHITPARLTQLMVLLHLMVCDPRKNALLKAGNKNDRVDAQKLSDLLRAGLLTPVHHGGAAVRTLRELSRSYLTITKDLTRVMNRLKGLYRSWAIPCAGTKVYSRATVTPGWNNCRKQECSGAPSGCTSSSTHWCG